MKYGTYCVTLICYQCFLLDSFDADLAAMVLKKLKEGKSVQVN